MVKFKTCINCQALKTWCYEWNCTQYAWRFPRFKDWDFMRDQAFMKMWMHPVKLQTNGNPNSAMIFHFVGGMLVFLKTLTKDWASFFGLPKELGEIFIGVC